MKKVLIVFGTRPEAIKCCPVVLEMKKRPELDVKVCATGQHREMLDRIMNAFNVVPDYDLNIMKNSQTLFDITINVLSSFEKILKTEKPDLILVQGDTTTAFTAGLAAFYLKIPVGHIEAGLRTYNIYSPYPEEFNRQAIGIFADYHFAPTETAKNNLIKEGKNPDRIWVTGNTSIDALKTTVTDNYKNPILDWVGDRKLIILTAHRRENVGEPMKQMLSAIRRIAEEFKDIAIVYPVHPNPAVKETAEAILFECDNIKLVSPLDVLDFHNLMARSYMILTDSGGVQEEAPSLGKPVLVMRDTTERPEGVESGTLKLVGTTETDIYKNFYSLLTDQSLYTQMSNASNPYGDGYASNRISDVIEKSL